MGNEIFIQNKRVCLQPLRSRLRGNTKAAIPHYSKGMQMFCGNGQFPMYDLSRVTEIIKANI